MSEPWPNFVSAWWPAQVGTDVSVLPLAQADGLWRTSWPTIGTTSWSTLPFSSGAQGGLLASLNAGAGHGLLGRLAAPTQQLDSAYPQGLRATLSRPSVKPISVPQSRGRAALPTDRDASVPQPLAAPPSRPPSNPAAVDSDAGAWTGSRDEDDSASQTLSDVTPDNEWIPGANYAAEGHHEFPRALYKRMPPETQKVFDRATSGRLYLGVDNRRHEFDRLHREYNEATGQLLQRFMGEQNIREPEQMTPNHARAVLKAIAESEDPRIRLYGEFRKRLRLFYRLRTG